jgi:hypothetical protein
LTGAWLSERPSGKACWRVTTCHDNPSTTEPWCPSYVWVQSPKRHRLVGAPYESRTGVTAYYFPGGLVRSCRQWLVAKQHDPLIGGDFKAIVYQ